MSFLEIIAEGLYFESVKLVTVKNLKLAFFHRAIQLCVVAYIVVFAIWYKQGYQATSEIKGVVYTKVKGVSHGDKTHPITFDAPDLVIPALMWLGSENGAVFIATRSLNTIQTQGICPDDSDPLANNCASNEDCKEGASTTWGWVQPGQCDLKTKKCNVSAWCPIERGSDQDYTQYEGIENWTIFFRSEIVYDKFDIKASNADEVSEGVNLFSVKNMLKGHNLSTVFRDGAIVNIQLDWSCDLDTEACQPKFIFELVDASANSTSRGFNFRRALYLNDNVTTETNPKNVFQTRVLTKFYGIRFSLGIKGLGRKFDLFTLVVTFGSGIAFFSGATLATDMLLQYLHPKREKFNKAKHRPLAFEEDGQTNPLIPPPDSGEINSTSVTLN